MECYVCRKAIKESQRSVYVLMGCYRHEHCAPMTRNFRTAFPDAWSNKYVREDGRLKEIPKRRLLNWEGE